jgi:hypothetical protein
MFWPILACIVMADYSGEANFTCGLRFERGIVSARLLRPYVNSGDAITLTKTKMLSESKGIFWDGPNAC